MQVITITLQLCEKAHIELTAYQQSFLPWLSSLWHIIKLNFILNEGHSFVFTESLVVDQRHLYLSLPLAQNDKCVLRVTINPMGQLPGDQTKYSYAMMGDSGPNNIDIPTYYDITGLSDMSWVKSAALCDKVGAHLPIMDSEDARNLLESLIFKMVASVNHSSYLPGRCRHMGPLCGVFVGLSGDMVSSYCILYN